jgi:solute carrier family 38 (sodium-coupled neutral amino acid transporter), member 11
MALAGVLVFKDKTMGNILNNFPSENGLVNLARFCFGFNCFTTLPLELFVYSPPIALDPRYPSSWRLRGSCREVITNYYWPSEPFHPKRHFYLTTILVFSAMLISLVTSDLSIVLEITGSTSAVAIAFLLPPLCYMRLTGAGEWRSWARERKWWGPALCTGFAGALMIVSIVQVVVEILTGRKP